MLHLFGSSGIRTVANRDLFTLAFKVGMAVGKTYPRVVLARDTRTSGDALKHAVISGLLAAGADCTDAGVAPTPTLAFLGREYDAGVMITASHNPPEYNGIKLWNPDGSAFHQEQQKHIEEMVERDALAAAPWQDFKQAISREDAVIVHSKRILKDFPEKLKTKVVVDCGCGAATVITPLLLREMGCEVLALNSHPTGFFPRVIEPAAENLSDLIAATLNYGAAVGIAHDGDADRMMAVDEKGRFITGDKLLVLLGQALKTREAVTTVDASMAVEEAGFTTRRTKVGDSFVSEELMKGGGEFGGEPSGAWIFPKVSYCPDGIYAAALIASLASTNRLSEMVDAVKSYPIIRGAVPSLGTTLADIEPSLLSTSPLNINRADGLRLGFEDGWMLVRPSGTEPKMRLTVEARTEARARQLYDQGMLVIQNCIATGRNK